MHLVLTLLVFCIIFLAVSYGLLKGIVSLYKKISHFASNKFDRFFLRKDQKEAVSMVRESISLKSVSVEKKEFSEGKNLSHVVLVFKSDKFSLGYEQKLKQKFLNNYSFKNGSDSFSYEDYDVSLIMYLNDSNDFVDASALNSKTLVSTIQNYLQDSVEAEKTNAQDFLFEKMKERHLKQNSSQGDN